MLYLRSVMTKIVFLGVIIAHVSCLSTFVSADSTFFGNVVHVLYGDTISVFGPGNQQVKVRLYGIDCPEKGQAFGQKARHYTAARVAGRNVQVRILGSDRYGRAVGVVRTDDGSILNQELLTNGYAWLYTRYCKAPFCSEWRRKEMRARKAEAGLWIDKNAIAPWEWRRANNGRPQIPRISRHREH